MKVTDNEIAEALHKSGGILNEAAKGLGVSRQTIANRLKQSEELKKVQKDAREDLIDTAEFKTFAEVRKGTAWACKLVLTRLAKDRGWTQKLEVEGNLDQTGRVIVHIPHNNRDPAPEPVGIESAGDGERNER